MSNQSITITPEFARALSILETGGNLFLTGEAGTGKSTLIRRFIDQTARKVVVAAPTGIAALNVGGYTLHRLFGFRPGTTLDEVANGSYRPTQFTKTLRAIETLIIDEASMVRADMFDMIAAALERFGPVPGQRFGGVQVVLVGDLFQLPPVVQATEQDYFKTRYETPYFFSADLFRRDDFPTVTLTTVFRQLGDIRLTNILNAIREGVLLTSAQEEINSRTDTDFEPPDHEFWLTLAPTNVIVKARNQERLARLPGDLHEHVATTSGDLVGFDPPVEDRLQFKVGAQVMMLTNDGGDRWVNGTLGRITAVGWSPPATSVTVEFRDGTMAAVSPHTWEATVPVVEAGVLRHEVVGTFTQLPFKLAWAITIHKSQGQTLDRLVVDLSGGAFDFGQVYVALSRCTTMEGLVLKRPVLAKDLKTDRRVLRFLRSSEGTDNGLPLCAIGLLTVGDEGRFSRPRPVEIAVAFDDGAAISTLINPQRDLSDARTRYGITTDDVLLAPTLAEAWASFAPLLEGITPVGVEIDETLALIDFELKRSGTVAPLPLGIDVPRSSMPDVHRPSTQPVAAIDIARTMLAAYHSSPVPVPTASGFPPVEASTSEIGYLLTRDPELSPPHSDQMPWVSQLLDVSRLVGRVLLADQPSGSDAIPAQAPRTVDPSVCALVSRRLSQILERVPLLPSALSERLQLLERELEISLPIGATSTAGPSRPSIGDALVSGARICFTGEAQTEDGASISRRELEERAQTNGLVPVKNVSRTRCDVLIVAEIGTQSGKAKTALEHSKPIYSVAEYLCWCDD